MSITYTTPELRKIAQYHKLLLWSILVAILANLIRLTINNTSIVLPIYFAAVGFQIFALYNLGKSLKLSIVLMIFLFVCLFIPLLSLIILLFIHSQAVTALKAAGIKVGFMGADPESI
ncbi:hypothetical protein ACSQ6I_04205 [Anabaena sp. WFMT]|uniref:hypothetical protein n=1 Tax=Anabaena sp. WFMT TaxID=3449730 RepID=UPI003F1F73C9